MIGDLPFRVDTMDGCSYLVEDGGDRSRPLIHCPNRVATPAEVALWAALERISGSEIKSKSGKRG